MYAHVLVSDILIVLTCLEKGSPFYYLDVSSNVFSLMSVFVVLADMLFDSNHLSIIVFYAVLAVVLVNRNALMNIESTLSNQDWFFPNGKAKQKYD